MAIRFNGHTINLNTIKKVRFNGHTVYKAANPLKLTSQQDGSTIAYTITGTITAAIQISTDGLNWSAWDGTAITLNNGEFRYIKNTNNALSLSTSNYFKFVITGLIAASGNCNSMINYSQLSEYCYDSMFYNCTGLTSAPSLPATTLANYCYKYMFRGCSSLTSAPSLPATQLSYGCYDTMFANCTALTSAPSLPATQLTINCYHSMFCNCTALTSAPSLPATTLIANCYGYMFKGCSNLKINENGSEGTTIFTCPSIPSSGSVIDMFLDTGGSFTGTPTEGNTYKYYA